MTLYFICRLYVVLAYSILSFSNRSYWRNRMKFHYSKISASEKERKETSQETLNKRKIRGPSHVELDGEMRKEEKERKERPARRAEKQIKKQKSSEVKECSTLVARVSFVRTMAPPQSEARWKSKENSIRCS